MGHGDVFSHLIVSWANLRFGTSALVRLIIQVLPRVLKRCWVESTLLIQNSAVWWIQTFSCNCLFPAGVKFPMLSLSAISIAKIKKAPRAINACVIFIIDEFSARSSVLVLNWISWMKETFLFTWAVKMTLSLRRVVKKKCANREWDPLGHHYVKNVELLFLVLKQHLNVLASTETYSKTWWVHVSR